MLPPHVGICFRLSLASRSRAIARLQIPVNCRLGIDFYSGKRNLSTNDPGPYITLSTEPFPTEARVVIAGGGTVGCSVAYHLAKTGWKDIVLLEQGRLGCGSTWASSGIVGLLRSTEAELAIVSESYKLYKQLQADGHDLDFRSVGALSLCRKMDRVMAYKRSSLIAQRFGIESEFLSPTEVKARVPILRTEDLLGAMWIPNDSTIDPIKLTTALAKEATKKGVQIFEKCRINQVNINDGRVVGVETSHGHMACEVFVNCAGQWAHDLGRHTAIPVKVPLHPVEHTVVISKPFAGVNRDMPSNFLLLFA